MQFTLWTSSWNAKANMMGGKESIISFEEAVKILTDNLVKNPEEKLRAIAKNGGDIIVNMYSIEFLKG